MITDIIQYIYTPYVILQTMDDENLFEVFLRDTLSVQSRRVRDAITDFITTFSDLLASTDEDIDTFVKETHSPNLARAVNQKMLIPTSVVTSLKSVLFELRNRDKCDALPNVAALTGIENAQLNILKNNRRTAISMENMRKSQKLPDMIVPKLTNSNFETFNTAFSSAVSRQLSLAGVPLAYLLWDNEVGNYDGNWATREDRLHGCLKFSGPLYKDDRESLYSLLVQHVGSTGVGSNIINKYKVSKSGRSCYVELKKHFQNTTHLENEATATNRILNETRYYG